MSKRSTSFENNERSIRSRARTASMVPEEDIPVIFGQPSLQDTQPINIVINNIPRVDSSESTSSSDSDKYGVNTFPWHLYRESKAKVEKKTPKDVVEYLNDKIILINDHENNDGSDLELKHDKIYHNLILKDADGKEIKKGKVAIISFLHKELDFLYHGIDKTLSLTKRDKPHTIKGDVKYVGNNNYGGIKKKTKKRKTKRRKTIKRKNKRKTKNRN